MTILVSLDITKLDSFRREFKGSQVRFMKSKVGGVEVVEATFNTRKMNLAESLDLHDRLFSFSEKL